MGSLVTRLTAASKKVAAQICASWANHHQERMTWSEAPGTLPGFKGIELYVDSYNGWVVAQAKAYADGFHAGWCFCCSEAQSRIIHGKTTTGAAVTVHVPPGVKFPGGKETSRDGLEPGPSTAS